jgi:hypothetical protein
MQMMCHTKTLGIVEENNSVRKQLTEEEKAEIKGICVDKLFKYYERLV